LKEMCFDVFLERNKRMGHGEKYTTMNYMKYLISQTLLIISKLKDGHRQGTGCVWTVIGLAWAGQLIRMDGDRTSMGRALGAYGQ
jgi:hypothetical protein